jgi:hypothetical protein
MRCEARSPFATAILGLTTSKGRTPTIWRWQKLRTLAMLSVDGFVSSVAISCSETYPMNAEPDVEKDEEGLETERQTTSMQDQLRKEVASWSKERRHQSSETVVAPSQPVVQHHSPRSATKPKNPRASSLQGAPASARSKPFSMSYDGMTQAEYIQYLRDRGLR